ncbi:MAG: AAA family ATPase [Candidatus Saganbacteria bacterium]|nr:AAA family ATPase [Candidatus Saganbacteria bacterium]
MDWKKLLLSLLLVCITASLAAGITSDELYSRAAQKYLSGDLAGAEADLERVLSIDSAHDKAKQLLGVVRREMGVSETPTTTLPTTSRAPKPQPVVRTTPVRRPAAIRVTTTTIAASRGAPAIVLPQAKSPDFADMETTINQIMLLILTVIVFTLIIAARGTYFIIRDTIASRRRQTCPDCKTKNPETAEFCQVCGTRLKVWSGITGNQKKWFDKFGWKHNPFTLDVLPNLFTGYSAQVGSIMEKINTRSGHILVYGDKGVGKTTLLRWLTDNLKPNNHAVYIARPPLNFDDMLRFVVGELKGGRFSKTKKISLYDIEELVKKAKKPLVILLDEAHEFTAEIEQQMRSLGDIQGVNYVLGGLPETREKIKKDSPPFFDRIVLEVYIDHLSQADTKEMIRKRIEDAGGKGIKPFTDEAIENIYRMSKGRPRMILKVCDWVTTDAIRNNLDVIGGQAGQDFPAAKSVEEASAKEKEGQSR